MKRKANSESVEVLNKPATVDEQQAEFDRLERLSDDLALARRCVAGEVKAWEELHTQCNDSLQRIVRLLLSHQSNDENLADEITARVWYALVANDGELLTRYDPGRGARLITFMRAIARDEVRRYFRSERRRRVREDKTCRDKSPHYSTEMDQVDVALHEFLDTLSPSEREFCGDFLLDSPVENADDGILGMSRANFWQKTHRVYVRFVKFFGHKQ
jgi:hypothetical protein